MQYYVCTCMNVPVLTLTPGHWLLDGVGMSARANFNQLSCDILMYACVG